MHMESSLDEHRNELSIKHITLGIYQLGCHLGNKRFLRMPTQKMNVNLGDYNDRKKRWCRVDLFAPREASIRKNITELTSLLPFPPLSLQHISISSEFSFFTFFPTPLSFFLIISPWVSPSVRPFGVFLCLSSFHHLRLRPRVGQRRAAVRRPFGFSPGCDASAVQGGGFGVRPHRGRKPGRRMQCWHFSSALSYDQRENLFVCSRPIECCVSTLMCLCFHVHLFYSSTGSNWR